MSQDGLAGTIVERNFAPGDFPPGSAFRKNSGAFLELSFYLHDFEPSLETHLGSFNRAVCLGDGVYGSIERGEISREDAARAEAREPGKPISAPIVSAPART